MEQKSKRRTTDLNLRFRGPSGAVLGRLPGCRGEAGPHELPGEAETGFLYFHIKNIDIRLKMFTALGIDDG